MISFITELDFAVLAWIQSLRTDMLDLFFPFITKFGNIGLIWIVIGIVLLFFRKTRICGICVLVCLAVDCLIGEGILKHIFCRERPCVQQPIEDMLLPIPTTSSFPSGHSASSFTAATAIFLNNRKAGIAAYIPAALIAFSRLYCYVHFPSDVLCGILLGTYVALVLTPRLQKYLSAKFCKTSD